MLNQDFLTPTKQVCFELPPIPAFHVTNGMPNTLLPTEGVNVIVRPGFSQKAIFDLIVPVKDNAQRAFPEAKLDALRHQIRQNFGGYTSWPVSGCWVDPTDGTIYCEDAILFRIALPLGLGLLDLIDSLAIKVRKDFQQREVFCSGTLVIMH